MRGPSALALPVAVILPALVLALLAVPRADAFIYWEEEGDSIARANLDGSGVDTSFIVPRINPSTSALGQLALGDEHIYWSWNEYLDPHDWPDRISRASLTGAGPQEAILDTDVKSLAVGRDFLYWGHDCCLFEADGSWISRSGLDGGNAEERFIDFGADGPLIRLLAVGAEHLYWVQWGEDIVGRVDLDGSDPEPAFLTLPAGAKVLVLDGRYVLWTTDEGRTIARRSLEGPELDPSWIVLGDAAPGSGASWAADDEHMYWAHGRMIGRAGTDGSVDPSFIDNASIQAPSQLLVDGRTDPRVRGSASARKTQRQGGKRVVVEVLVKAGEKLEASGRGRLRAAGRRYRLQPVSRSLIANGRKVLRLQPSRRVGRLVRSLKRGKVAKARIKVTLRDAAENTKKQQLRARLKR
jgi:hypothetical protein